MEFIPFHIWHESVIMLLEIGIAHRKNQAYCVCLLYKAQDYTTRCLSMAYTLFVNTS